MVAEYEWFPDPRWFVVHEEHICRSRGCGRPAVAMFYRERFTRRPSGIERYRWYCCDRADHMYGRRIRDGRVEAPYLIGSPAWEQMKATQNSGAGKEA